ncbi:MAG TPA: vitamin K epoxide reductase family protein [Acidimicrobiales bacterium]|nr:vitamin K epoxide reductase family protein [Acidimicrobiales bacterium]
MSDADVEQDQGQVYELPTLPTWRPWAAFLLSIIGFGVSMYLTVEHFTGAPLSCPDTGVVNCLKVTTSKWSYIFGIPVSLLGLLFFTAMVVINFPRLWRVNAAWVAVARLALAVSGICFVLYLLAAELFSIKAICLWCTGVHVTTFLLFVLVVVSFPLMSPRALRYREWVEAEEA